jgi:hypothetical protein
VRELFQEEPSQLNERVRASPFFGCEPDFELSFDYRNQLQLLQRVHPQLVEEVSVEPNLIDTDLDNLRKLFLGEDCYVTGVSLIRSRSLQCSHRLVITQ